MLRILWEETQNAYNLKFCIMKNCTLNSLSYSDFDFLYNKFIFNKFLIFCYKKLNEGKSLETQILFHTLLSFFHTFPNPVGTLHMVHMYLYYLKNLRSISLLKISDNLTFLWQDQISSGHNVTWCDSPKKLNLQMQLLLIFVLSLSLSLSLSLLYIYIYIYI